MRLFRRLVEPDITPGLWYRIYSRDFSKHYGIPVEQVIKHSAIVEGTNGYIWASSTPGFDLKWFNNHGFRFPSRWVPYEILKDYKGLPGEVVRLDV